MNKKYILVLFLVVIAGIVMQNVSAAPISTSANPSTNNNPAVSNMVQSTNDRQSNSQPTVIEQAKTQFIQFVEPPYNATYDNFGTAVVKFRQGTILSVDGYRQICIEAEASPTTIGFDLIMGKIKGTLPLAFPVANNQSLDAKIHCYPVSAPDMILLLRGAPGANDQVSFWIYLMS